MWYTERTCDAIKGQVNVKIFNKYGISYLYLVHYLHPDECLLRWEKKGPVRHEHHNTLLLSLKVERKERNQACSG